MSQFNSDYWEVPAGTEYLENLPSTRALWYETEEDRQKRYALEDFFQEVQPLVWDIIDDKLTKRQREIVTLYYLHGKTQEDIAAILDLSQSTVSRHLFGTVRQGKKVGGAVPKLRKVIEKNGNVRIHTALDTLRACLDAPVG